MTAKEVEQFRIEMIEAFHIYSGKESMHDRHFSWLDYCQKREHYLSQSAKLLKIEYNPLSYSLVKEEGH